MAELEPIAWKKHLELPMGSKEWLAWWKKEQEAIVASQMRDKRYAHRDPITKQLIWHVPCNNEGVPYRDIHDVNY